MSVPTLFDKSFLQSLSVDESVWFDTFFLPNVCPLFYVETLADLGKENTKRGPERDVQIIAEKFPESSGTPNINHSELVVGNLLGSPVPMNGQIPVPGGRPVKTGEQRGVVFEPVPEVMAFHRWQSAEFYELEQQFAKNWRKSLSDLDLKGALETFAAMGVDLSRAKNLEEARSRAIEVVSSTNRPFDLIRLAIICFDVPRELHVRIVQRWTECRHPPLPRYAPYAAYALTLEIFFQIAVASGLIAAERPSNRMDIGYLFYLPFCNVFTSSDKLHRRTAPLFLRKNQEFCWGPDLKSGLNELNSHFLLLPDEVKQSGLHSFATKPPETGGFYVSGLWDRHLAGWRNKKDNDVNKTLSPKSNETLVKMLNEFTDAPTALAEEIDFDISNPDSVSMRRMVKRKKGSWYQIGTHVPNPET